jgi:hypothetical protein
MTDAQSQDPSPESEVSMEEATGKDDETKTFEPPEVDPSLLWDITQEEPDEADNRAEPDE